MADDVVLVCDAVSSQHVSALPGDVQGFTAAVPLQHGDHVRGGSVGRTFVVVVSITIQNYDLLQFFKQI